MAKVSNITKARRTRPRDSAAPARHEGFQPCSPDMTICGDCQDNRVKNKCPRFNEWLEKRKG